MSEEIANSPAEEVVAETTEEVTTEEQSDGVVYAGKFKTVSDLEKSYQELQSTFSKKMGAFEGAPEEYSIPEGFSEDDPSFSFVSQWGRDNNMSEKGLHDLVTKYRDNQSAMQEEYMKAEVEKLGKDADYRIKNVTDWAKANLGDDYVDSLNAAFPGAKGIEALEKIMKISSVQQPTTKATAPTVDSDQIKAMRFAKDEFGNRKMSTDPAYRKRVEALEAELYATR